MTAWEKNTWILLLCTVFVMVLYVVVFLLVRNDHAFTDIPYQLPMLGCIAAGAVAGFLLVSVTGGLTGERDERDLEIERVGDRVGGAFFVLATFGSLILAMLEVDHFWISHLVFAFVLISGILASLSRIAAYRGDFQRW